MKLIKKLSLIVAGLILFLLLAVVGLSFYVSSLLTEDFIVHQLEGLFNARFALKKYSFSLLSGGDLVLEEVAIGPRDRFANQATPLSKRSPMKGEVLAIGEFGLHLDIFKIFSGVLHIKSFALDKPKIHLILYAKSGNNLSPLFGLPAIVAGKKNPALAKQKKNAAAIKQSKEEKEPTKQTNKDSSKPMRAQDIPLAANLEKIGIENGDVKVHLQATGDTLHIKNLDFLVTDIELDPNDLQNKNGANIDFKMQLAIYTKAKQETAHLKLVSGGRVIPFDKRSGRIDPNINYDLNIKKGSYLSGFTVLEKLGDKADSLQKIGVSPAKLKEKFILSADTKTRVNYWRGVIRVLNDFKLLSKSYDFLVKKGALFYVNKASHSMEAEVWLSKADSRKFLLQLDKALEKNLKLSSQEAQGFRDKHFATIIRDGRLYLPFRSKGPFRNPDVNLTAPLPSYQALLKDVGRKVLDKEKKKIKEKVKKKATEELKKEGQKLLKKLF